MNGLAMVISLLLKLKPWHYILLATRVKVEMQQLGWVCRHGCMNRTYDNLAVSCVVTAYAGKVGKIVSMRVTHIGAEPIHMRCMHLND